MCQFDICSGCIAWDALLGQYVTNGSLPSQLHSLLQFILISSYFSQSPISELDADVYHNLFDGMQPSTIFILTIPC